MLSGLELSLVLSIIFSFFFLIKAEYRKQEKQKYFFKPLTITLVIVLASVSNGFNFNEYKTLIIIGLIFSLFGDVFLMFPETRFIHGLISFLLAHIFYIIAFNKVSTESLSLLFFLPFLLYGFIYYFYLYSSLAKKLKIPVLIYMFFIVLMGFSALNIWITSEKDFSLAFYGALFFVASDSILAFNKFKKKFVSAQFFILFTYFIAQILISLSIKSSINF